MALPYPYEKFTTSRDLTYGYIHIKPKQEKDYILFLHGFPSGSHDWRYQVEFFEKKGYGIIVPDCLGYGQTSKPLDTSLYTGKGMANDITEILYHEEIYKIIGVGHDWGSFLLSRLLNYHPTLFSKLVFIDIGYSLPGRNLTEQTCRFVNSMVKDKMGYEVFGYFLFFKEEDAAELLTAHADSVLSLFHTRDEEIGKRNMGAEGGIRTWLEAGKIADAPGYLSKEDREYDQKFFSAENGGFGPSINWYKAQLEDLNDEDDKGIPQENISFKQPTLLLQGNNFITATADFAGLMKPLVPDLTVEKLDAGHWIMLERPAETNALMEKFLEQ